MSKLSWIVVREEPEGKEDGLVHMIGEDYFQATDDYDEAVARRNDIAWECLGTYHVYPVVAPGEGISE